MKTYNNSPIFLANVDDEVCTITTISLVDDPAMQLPMYCFSKDEKMKFSMQEDKHNIISCIVRTDYPILRLTDIGTPYYVVFNRATAEKICQKLMTDGFQQCISLDHNGQLIGGIQLQEVFIKDRERGIDPIGFDDAADGSLFGVYHITDEDLWKDCLEGRFGGVSMESYFQIEEFRNIDTKNNKKNMANKIKEALKRLLMEFNNLSTDKAELYWEEDSELGVGYKVFVEDESGNKVAAPDGEYISDENKITVEGGVVTEIESKDAETPAEEEKKEEETPAEEKVEAAEEVIEETKEETKEEETPAENTEESEDKVAELEKRIADLENTVAELINKIAEISSAPAATPVVDEFEQVTKKKTSGDKNLDKRIALAAALKD